MNTRSMGALRLVAAATTLGLTACGGGGSGSSSMSSGSTSGGAPGSNTTTSVSGAVASGIVVGGLVTATCGGTSIGAASTDSSGVYTITLSTDCSGPVLLTAAPPASGSMTVADEMSPGPVAVGPLAAGEQWRLRAYTNLVAGQANTQHVTAFTDMAAAVVDKVTALSAPLGTQANLPLTAGLVIETNAAVANAVLGGDPHGILPLSTMQTADPPISPANLTTSSPLDQRQLMEMQAAISVWASASGSYQYVAGGSYFVPTSTCGDPVVCSTTGKISALALLEQSITDEIGVHFAIGSGPNTSQMLAFMPSTAQQATLPAYALQNIAVGIETTNSYGVPSNIAAAAAATAGTPDAASGLLATSQISIQNGVTF